MKRDPSIYDKYLNMKPKEKKKLDLTVKFDSKIQKVGVILFGIGLLFLIVGFCILFFKKFDDRVVPEENGVIENVNIKDFQSISSEDGLVTIGDTTVTYKKELGLSEMNFDISVKEDVDELPIKIIFYLDGEEVVIADLLGSLSANDSVSLFKQNERDLSMADSWKVEVTTKEDLATNYGFDFSEE